MALSIPIFPSTNFLVMKVSLPAHIKECYLRLLYFWISGHLVWFPQVLLSTKGDLINFKYAFGFRVIAIPFVLMGMVDFVRQSSFLLAPSVTEVWESKLQVCVLVRSTLFLEL